MSTRLGLHDDEVFEYILNKRGGFTQGLLRDNGYMIPHHEYTMSLPASLAMDMKYRIYEMYTCFVRTPLTLNKHLYISCTQDEMFYVLRLMEYYDNQEDARCKHKQLGNDEYDFYNLEEFKVTEISNYI